MSKKLAPKITIRKIVLKKIQSVRQTIPYLLDKANHRIKNTLKEEKFNIGISKMIAKIDTRHVTGYNVTMIKSFAHKGLKDFYESGSKKGIQAEHANKLARILDRLDASLRPQDMNLPGYRLHPLKGSMDDFWSVTVNGNWRITFYFEGQDAYLVDYTDYH